MIVAGVAFETARRRQTPAEIALLLGVSRIGVLLVGVGALLVLGFGLWLVDSATGAMAPVGSTLPWACLR
jgi:hypothetical protein